MSTTRIISSVAGHGSLAFRRTVSVAPRGMSFGAGCALSTAARTSNGDGKRVPHITLYTGTDCSLCDVVKDVLLQAQSEADFTIAYYNIRDDSMPDIQKWRRQYQYDIPVCHLDGKEIARHRLDKDHLLQQVAKAACVE